MDVVGVIRVSSSSVSQDMSEISALVDVTIVGGKIVSTFRCELLLLGLFFSVSIELNRLLTLENVEYSFDRRLLKMEERLNVDIV